MTIPKSEYVEFAGCLCVTMDMIEKYHTEAETEQFNAWHSGQTGLVLPNGTVGIYSWDYERWCEEGNLDGQLPETWD